MKKIIIFYASYGGGHLSAAKSLEKHLNENYTDLDVELVDCMKYVNKTIEKVSTAAYREMAKKIPWAWGKIYNDSQKGPLAHISSRANSIMAIKLSHLLSEKNPDIIISTHPFGSQLCSYLKRKGKLSCPVATILTDFKSHDQWLVGSDYIDYFFVSNESMKQELIDRNIDASKIHVTGIPVGDKFLVNYDKKTILDELNFSKNKKTILFFAGGEFGLGKNKTLEVFECLIKNFDNIQVIAISGRNQAMKDNFVKIVLENDKQANVHIFEYTDKIAQFMSICDLVISKPGGLTTSESLVSNVPMLIINPIPGQEEENAEFLENNKIGIWLKKDSDIYLTLNVLLNDDSTLNNLKQNISSIAKPDSTRNICDIILKTC